MEIKPRTPRRLFETALPAVVLIILLVYTYVRFFLVPYAGFQFNVSTGEIVGIFAAQQQTPRLELGDRLLSVNGIDWDGYVADLNLPLPMTAHPGEIISLVVEGQQGKQIDRLALRGL